MNICAFTSGWCAALAFASILGGHDLWMIVVFILLAILNGTLSLRAA